jgi:cytochrome c-type biogenesis protein CcmF
VLALAAIFAGVAKGSAVLAFAFVGYAAVANLREYYIGAAARRKTHRENWVAALVNLVNGNRGRYGGYLAHVGIFVAALGVAASSALRVESEATITRGGTMIAGRDTLRLRDVWARDEPQRFVVGATVDIMRGGSVIGTVEPRMNYYRTSQEPVPTPAVRSSFTGDLYFNLMAFDQQGANATIRVIVEPLVPWIWAGGGIVVLGAIIAVLPRRSRQRSRASRRPAPAVAAEEPMAEEVPQEV